MSSPSPDRPGASRPPGQPGPPSSSAPSGQPVSAGESAPTGHANLVGRQIEASIGEPWDFTSMAGDNLLTGRVTATSADREVPEWLICEVSPFAAGAVQITTVAAIRRYACEEPIQQLHEHSSAHVHLLYDPSGGPLTPPRVTAALCSGHDDLKHLIGTLRLST